VLRSCLLCEQVNVCGAFLCVKRFVLFIGKVLVVVIMYM
jgi:hypothetical protein